MQQGHILLIAEFPRRRPPTSHVMFETVWVRDAVLLMSSKNYSKSVGQKIGL